MTAMPEQQQQQERRPTLRVPLKRILRHFEMAELARALASPLTEIAFRGSALFKFLILRRFEDMGGPCPPLEPGTVMKILQSGASA